MRISITVLSHFIAVDRAQSSVTLSSIVFGFQSPESIQRMHECRLHFLVTVDPILQFQIQFMYRFKLAIMKKKHETKINGMENNRAKIELR